MKIAERVIDLVEAKKEVTDGDIKKGIKSVMAKLKGLEQMAKNGEDISDLIPMGGIVSPMRRKFSPRDYKKAMTMIDKLKDMEPEEAEKDIKKSSMKKMMDKATLAKAAGSQKAGAEKVAKYFGQMVADEEGYNVDQVIGLARSIVKKDILDQLNDGEKVDPDYTNYDWMYSDLISML